MTYDAAIVGAGPAGSAAAFHLARRGRRVVLVDKATFPRPKVCGDGLTPRALRAVSRMGVDLRDHCPVWVTAGRLVDRRRGTSRIVRLGPYRGPGAVVPRLTLDHLLVGAASSAGAEFRPATRAVALLRDGERVCGICVAGAHGSEDIVAQSTIIADGSLGRLGGQIRGKSSRRLHIGFAARQYFEDVDSLDPYFEIHLPLDSPTGCRVAGYGWVFPSGAGSANVGAGFFYSGRSEERIDLRLLHTSFVEALLAKDPRFRSARAVTRLEGAPLRVGMIGARQSPSGVILVGDAAGLVNPFTGEGIAQAIESGEAAAEEVDRGLPDPSRVSVCYCRRLARLYPRHYRLRESLPDLLAAGARLARRQPRGTGQPLGPAARGALRRLTLDHPPPARGGWLAEPLRSIERHHPELAQQLRAVRRLVRKRAASVRPVFGELTRYAHSGLPLPSELLATTLLLCARPVAGSEQARHALTAAAILELFSLSQLLQIDIPEGNAPPEAGRELGAGNVVLADVMTAVLVELAADLPQGQRRRLTAALLDCAAAAAATAGRQRRRTRSFTQARARLVGAAAEIGASIAGRPPLEVAALARAARWVGLAVGITADLLGDLVGVPALGIGPGLWIRRRITATSLLHGLRGPSGGPIRRLLARRTLSTATVKEILRVSAAAGAFRWAAELVEQARFHAEIALCDFDGSVEAVAFSRLAAGAAATAHTLAERAQGESSPERPWPSAYRRPEQPAAPPRISPR